eukprot:2509019-Amphidinium_carterae.1
MGISQSTVVLESWAIPAKQACAMQSLVVVVTSNEQWVIACTTDAYLPEWQSANTSHTCQSLAKELCDNYKVQS